MEKRISRGSPSPQHLSPSVRMISKELHHSFDDEAFNFACATVCRENHQQGDEMLMADTIDGLLCEKKLKSPLWDGGFYFACATDMNEENQKATVVASDLVDGEPHEALGFALAYLNVRDLLSVERVCKSLCDLVKDSLLWRKLHIDQPLNDRITNDILLQLTTRSQGSLQCLSLVECQRITDDGLKRILERNPRLTKLSVPGCTRLSIDGIVNGSRNFKLVASPGIKRLRITGLYGATREHFDELMSLMGIQNHAQANCKTPLFYQKGKFYLSCEDERPIDIETCPRCQKLRLVYDCLTESCEEKIMLHSHVGHAHYAFLVVFSAESVLLMLSTWRIFVWGSFVQFVGNSRSGVKRVKILMSMFLHSMARNFVGYLLTFLCGEPVRHGSGFIAES